MLRRLFGSPSRCSQILWIQLRESVKSTQINHFCFEIGLEVNTDMAFYRQFSYFTKDLVVSTRIPTCKQFLESHAVQVQLFLILYPAIITPRPFLANPPPFILCPHVSVARIDLHSTFSPKPSNLPIVLQSFAKRSSHHQRSRPSIFRETEIHFARWLPRTAPLGRAPKITRSSPVTS